MDIHQSKNYSKFIESLGWVVERIDGTNIFIRHLPLVTRWSVIKVQRPENVDFNQLDKIARKHHALFIKFEPIYQLTSLPIYQFTKDGWPLLPTKTLILDLKNATMVSLPKDTRYEIRQAEKHQVRIEPSQDILLFYKLLQQTMKIGHWSVPIRKEVVNLWNSFQPNNSQLLLAYHDRLPVGGCLLIWEGGTAHYMYAALTEGGRKFGAAYAILWKAIQFCQKRKLKYLDLEGIYDERFPSHTKNWQGFTKFKMGWGGKVLEYKGAYTKYFNPLARLLFSLGNSV